MAHWALGTAVLVGGGLVAAAAPAAGGATRVYLVVTGVVLVSTGIGLLLAARGGRDPASRRDALRGSLAEIERDGEGASAGLLRQAFAVTHDEAGDLCTVDRDEVDAVFRQLMQRWQGPLALAMSRLEEDADAGFSDSFERAASELRGDILRMERYLDGLLFRDPAARLSYLEILAELDGLLQRLEGGRGGVPSRG